MISRRSLCGAMAGAALMNAETQKTRAVVVGAGVFGVWTAYHLQKTGRYDVTVIDAWGAGNSRSSSGGESRIIRASYGPDEIYSRMASDSLAQWRALLGSA